MIPEFLELLAVMAASFFFSGMEIAYVSAEKMRLEVNRSRYVTMPIVAFFMRRPSSFISTMLVGNNVAMVLYGILTSKLIDTYILTDPAMSSALRLLLETLISTAVIICLCEFLPKTLFKLNPNLTLNLLSPLILPIYFLLYPVSWLLRMLSALVLRFFGMKLSTDYDRKAFSKVDLDDYISNCITDAADSVHLDSEVKIFRNVLDFGDVKVRDCMIPRNEMVTVRLKDEGRVLLDRFMETGLSRILVCGEDIDDVVGYIHSSELFRHFDNWSEHLIPLDIVPETMNADRLLRDLKRGGRSLAVVVDEFGGTSGMVTLEDLVEEILGEIEDEHDSRRYLMEATPQDGGYDLSARLEIDRVNEALGLDLPISPDYQTVGGLLLDIACTLPVRGSVITVGPYDFTVLQVKANRIETVHMVRRPE